VFSLNATARGGLRLEGIRENTKAADFPWDACGFLLFRLEDSANAVGNPGYTGSTDAAAQLKSFHCSVRNSERPLYQSWGLCVKHGPENRGSARNGEEDQVGDHGDAESGEDDADHGAKGAFGFGFDDALLEAAEKG
jgi:hypothetical protein